MAIAQHRFCINRKIAPNLSLEQFFRVVKKCGLNKVELRNDMPSGQVTDGLSTGEVRALAQQYGMDIITINALGRFNLGAERDKVWANAEAMLQEAQAIGSRGLILCPHCSAGDARSAEQKQQETLQALIALAPLFKQYGVTGLVEPLGFGISSLRSSLLAQSLIRDSAAPYKLVIDTFHHHLDEVDQAAFDQQMAMESIGLVHLSGVEDPRDKSLLTDEERIMLSQGDLLKSKQQVDNLERLGYQGIYSFEPFSSVLENWQEADIEREIKQSMALIQG
ncbi:inosose isomerase [Chimaeribacter arupi]|uniref:Inosose isomerase n=2 Tax=Yersiniaceae TaxID=1903411 RepID=A0A2N5EPF9_9GAMM|nr:MULTISPECIES: TIM barrel protein [Yersiniaceae]MBS0968014.1 TIM barrel protein [Nissabacter archeti]MDV5140632.1 TIM barrel protein [Chimaeribacter arupi]PLR29870.1 inosose isomerase [Chimaeribacter arupi]PLR50406.1 inosose isomerase [Chimaeribacter arupi]PLR51178.1 inosose isomerase [Chimaeribacter arupi]